MHEHEWNVGTLGDLQHLGLGEPGHIVEDIYADVQRRSDGRRISGVDTDLERIPTSQRPNFPLKFPQAMQHRLDSSPLGCRIDGSPIWARGFGADVYDAGALLYESPCVHEGGLGFQKTPPVAEAIGSDIEDSHEGGVTHIDVGVR